MSRKFRTPKQKTELKNIAIRLNRIAEGKINQQQLADALGVCWRTAHRYLYDGVDNITTLLRICALLDVSYAYALSDDVTAVQQYRMSAYPCQRAGQVLRQLRRSKGLSQFALAQKMEVELCVVQQYEAKGINSISSVISIAQYFNIPLISFFII